LSQSHAVTQTAQAPQSHHPADQSQPWCCQVRVGAGARARLAL